MIKVGDIFYASGFYVIEKIEPQIVTKANKNWWCNKNKNIGDESLPAIMYRQIATKNGTKRVSKVVRYNYVDPNTWTPTMAKDVVEARILALNKILDYKI